MLAAERLRAFAASGPLRALVLAAHPDDEVIGVGGRLARSSADVHVAYASDGAPDDPEFFRAAGFETREEYASTRRREAREALALVSVGAERIHELGFGDQRVAEELLPLCRKVLRLVLVLRPEVVITHPYEGGHPDHDATAFAAHAVQHLLGGPCSLLEFTSYHERDGALVSGEFATADGEVRALELDASVQVLKRRMLACHLTQRAVLRQFAVHEERFRVAPVYDFGAAPPAPFFYDRLGWRVSGRDFLQHSQAALRELRIESGC